MDFRFADPAWLWLLAALPLMGAWHLLVARRRHGTLRFSDLGMMRGLPVKPRRLLTATPPTLRCLLLVLLVTAMARPQSELVPPR